MLRSSLLNSLVSVGPVVMDGASCPLVGLTVDWVTVASAYILSHKRVPLLSKLTITMLVCLIALVLMGCKVSNNSNSSTSTSPQSATPNNTRSQQILELGSVADLAAQVLSSVVQITAGLGSGTGFIITQDGMVVTNHHVIRGYERVTVYLVDGTTYQARVSFSNSDLDVAYLEIVGANQSFTPLVIGDSESIRVGDEVIAIGFPLGWTLGTEPTISRGIISAKREGYLQTDAPLNPGNSGGPLIDMSGQAVGVVVARVEEDQAGNTVAGISFAIPINMVKQQMPGGIPITAQRTPTPFPTVQGASDVEATKVALDALDERRRQVEEATRTAIETEQEARRYAASLQATRIAEIPTATPAPTPTPTTIPTPTPTSTPLPTPTPHPSTYCQEWETLVLDWIRQGNNYYGQHGPQPVKGVPSHPRLPAIEAHDLCVISFPTGILVGNYPRTVGEGSGQLLPGLYEYRKGVEKRVVREGGCVLTLNDGEPDKEQAVRVPYGKPFTFQFHVYHGRVDHYCGRLYRTGGLGRSIVSNCGMPGYAIAQFLHAQPM